MVYQIRKKAQGIRTMQIGIPDAPDMDSDDVIYDAGRIEDGEFFWIQTTTE